MDLLNVERHGSGHPLVMLHGLFGDVDNLRSFGRAAEAHFDVLRVDLPAHGRSPGLSRLTLADMATSVSQTLDSLGIDSCHLLGHSLGGKIAMTLAGGVLAHRVSRLVVVDIAPREYPRHHLQLLQVMQAMDPHIRNDRKLAEQALLDVAPEPAVRGFLLKSLRLDNGQREWRFDVETLLRDYDELRQAPPIASRIHCPVLFVKGGNSDYLRESDEPAIRAVVEQPQLRVIAGAGHWPHAEKPELFQRICLEFLQHNPVSS